MPPPRHPTPSIPADPAVLAVHLEHLHADFDDHEERISAHDARLHQGDLEMQERRQGENRLTQAMEALTDQLRAMSEKVDAVRKFDWKIEAQKALIRWGAPIAVLALLWLLLASHAMPLPFQVVPVGQTAGGVR